MAHHALRSAAVVGLWFVASVASAEDAADQKFEAAQKLREQGKVAEACALFKQALELNPNAIGTILNVARCAEESGKTGSAVRWFTEARDRAREQNLTPYVDAADEHIGKLVDHVPHLAIAFAEPPPPDSKISIDDRVIDAGATSDVVVDPGDVKVVVSAPGRVPFETTIHFDPKGDHERRALSVPRLGYPVTLKNTRRTVGKVLVGSGGGILMGGVVIGLIARAHYNTAIHDPHCTIAGDVTTCDDAPYGDAKRALDLGNIGTVVGIGGIVLAAGGAALWLLTPTHDERRVAVVPTLTPTEAGLAAVGRF